MQALEKCGSEISDVANSAADTVRKLSSKEGKLLVAQGEYIEVKYKDGEKQEPLDDKNKKKKEKIDSKVKSLQTSVNDIKSKYKEAKEKLLGYQTLINDEIAKLEPLEQEMKINELYELYE